MAMWMRWIVLTVMAVVPVIAGEIVRLADRWESAPATNAACPPSDCSLSELRWRTLEPPSVAALPAPLARARGANLSGC